MDDAARTALIRIIHDYGQHCASSPKKVKALLLDFCPECTTEINILTLAAQEGVPAALLKRIHKHPVGIIAPQLAQTLQDKWLVSEAAAQWAVLTWAQALNIELPSPTPSTPPPSDTSARQEVNAIIGTGIDDTDQQQSKAAPATFNRALQLKPDSVAKPINIRRITLTALMAALIFVLTTLPRVPVPATGGYVHLGDAGVTFAACAFGPWVAMAAGGLGTAMADLLGFPQWAIFSLIVHGLQGLAIGLILRRGLNIVSGVAATLASVAIVVGGYFIAGVILIGQGAAALEILPNTLQALSGSIVGIPLYWAVRRAYPPLERYSDRAA